MLNVYLLRHGETQYNAEGNKYCGRTDIDLTEKGVQQAELVRAQLEGMSFDAVYSSPLLRAKRTAQLASGIQEVTIDERLIEVDFGIWEGYTKEQFIPANPDLWESWKADPYHNRAGENGESGEYILSRLNSFYNDLVQKHPNGNVLVVGHNGINRLFLAHKLGMPLKNYQKLVQQNSSITRFELDEQGELSLNLLNSKL